MPLLNLPLDRLRQRTSLKWRAYDPDILPLWVAEMDADPHPAVTSAVSDALALGDTGYPYGSEYQQAFAAMAAARWGWRPEPDQFARVGDVMNAMLALLLGLTRDGDRILINPPVYTPFRQVVAGYRREVAEVHLVDGRLDLPGIEAALAGPDRPAAYLLCSPHNPTGTVHTADELRTVAELCRAHGVHLIADEIHAVLVDPGTPFVPLLSLPQAQDALVATSAGKGWNLAGFKGGLIVRGERAADALAQLPPLATQSTGQLAKIAHTAALTHAQEWVDELMAEIAANKRLLAEALAERLPAVRYAPAPGTYLAWLDCSALGLDSPARHFREVGRVALNDGLDYGREYGQFARMNLATSPEIVAEAVDRMARSLSGPPSP